MNKVLIIGSPGSGKSTLADDLRTRLRLPLHHLDKINWKNNKEYLPMNEFNAELVKILKTDKWIIDGNYNRTMALRMMYADTIIWLDIPRTTCLYQVSKGYFSNFGKKIAFGNPNKLSLKFLLFVWQFQKKNIPKIEQLIEKQPVEKKMIKLSSSEEINEFIESLKI